MTDAVPAGPVLIVGAGLAGLTAALELARMKVGVRIVDAATQTMASGPVVLHARTVELLSRRGLDLAALGGAGIRDAAVYSGGRLAGTVPLAAGDGQCRPFVLASRARAEHALRSLLATYGVIVESPARLIALAEDEPSLPGIGVHAVVRHGDGRLEEVAAPYLIGAGGAQGSLRRLLRQPAALRPWQRRHVLADLLVDGDLPADRIGVLVGRRPGYLATFPLAHGRFLFVADEPGRAYDGGRPGAEDLQRILSAMLPGPAQVRELIWCSLVPAGRPGPAILRQGPIFFAGEEAHSYGGASCQGANYGIQDMVNLGWKLGMVSRGEALPGLLETYRQERLGVIRDASRRADQAASLLGARGSLAHHLVTRIAPGLLDARFLLRLGADLVGEATTDYRDGPLSASCPGPGSIQAGDSLPDLNVLARSADTLPGTAAREIRLHELADPSRLTLLFADEGPEAAASPWPELVAWRQSVSAYRIAPVASRADERNRFIELLGDHSVLAVRPDLYVGFAGRTRAMPQLAAWLARWFPAGTGGVPASPPAARKLYDQAGRFRQSDPAEGYRLAASAE